MVERETDAQLLDNALSELSDLHRAGQGDDVSGEDQSAGESAATPLLPGQRAGAPRTSIADLVANRRKHYLPEV